jgi:anti-sigma28 factor (negative regulator of flagellin synthesis)
MMKIDMHPSYNVYRKTAGAASAVPGSGIPAGNKLDVIDITHGSTVTDKALVGMKAGVHSYLAGSAGPARLSQLREDIRGGAYHVATDDLVESILKG